MNYFLTSSNSQKRIIEDYLNYEKLIIACDFDSTLKPWNDYEGEHCDAVCELLKECESILGAFIILFTANRHPEKCVEWCEKKGITIHALNDNAPEALHYFLEKGYPEPPRKIFFNILLDDKAGLAQTYNELKTLVELVKSGVVSKIQIPI